VLVGKWMSIYADEGKASSATTSVSGTSRAPRGHESIIDCCGNEIKRESDDKDLELNADKYREPLHVRRLG
jgi:hypothetical protein